MNLENFKKITKKQEIQKIFEKIKKKHKKNYSDTIQNPLVLETDLATIRENLCKGLEHYRP